MTASQAVGFLTVLGRSGGEAEDSAPTPSALVWFPVVGAALGAGLGLSWWALLHIVPAAVAAVVVVGGDLTLTGLLHFDGLLDSADGLLPPLSRERRLEVMRDPHVGAFAVVTGSVVVLARVVALGSVVPLSWWRSTLLLTGLYAISRSVMVLAARNMAYARPGGLAGALLGNNHSNNHSNSNSNGTRDGNRKGAASPATTAAAVGVVAGAVALLAWRPLGGAVVLLASLAASAAVLALAQRRLGGFTGDVLGAAGVVGETVGLLVAAAKW